MKLISNLPQAKGILRRMRIPCARSVALRFQFTLDQRVNPGITVAFPEGEDAVAPGNGTVIAAETVAPFWAFSPGSAHATSNSYQVVIDHGFGLKTVVHGLQSVAVNVGQSVSRGQALGTPLTTEVFFAILYNGSPYDPMGINRHFTAQNGNVVPGQGGYFRFSPDFKVRDLSNNKVSTLIDGTRYFVNDNCSKPPVLINVDFNGSGNKVGLAATGIGPTDYWNVYTPVAFTAEVDVVTPSGVGNGLSSALQAYYKFDETSGNAADSSGNGRHLIEHGTIETDSGKLGNSRRHDASEDDDYFSTPSAAWNTFGANDFTIAFWFKPGTTFDISQDMLIISKWDFSAKMSWFIDYDRGTYPFDHAMLFWGSEDGINFFEIVKTEFYEFPDLNKWYFIYVKRSAGVVTISLTGEDLTTLNPGDSAAYAGTLFDNSTVPLSVGAVFNGTNNPDTSQDTGGSIDELGFWSTGLSTGELDSLFNGGEGFNFTEFNDTANGSLIFGVSGCGGTNFSSSPVAFLNDYTNTSYPVRLERVSPMSADAGAGSSFDPMLADYIGGYSGTAISNSFKLKGAPGGNFDLYLYSDKTSGTLASTFRVGVNGASPTVKQNTPTGATTFIESNNYVKYNLSLTAGDVVDITVEGFWSGMQLFRP
jgi:hypothetical protein